MLLLPNGYPTFVLSLLQNQLLVEVSGFLQIPRFNHQLLLQFLFKGNHRKSKKIGQHVFHGRTPPGDSGVYRTPLLFSMATVCTDVF